MGLIRGRYDAKAEGFLPGGASLHACMTPHGPDTATFERAIQEDSEAPAQLPQDSLAFMFEVSAVPRLTPFALGAQNVDRDYYQCWIGLKSHFDPRNIGGSDAVHDSKSSEARAQEDKNSSMT